MCDRLPGCSFCNVPNWLTLQRCSISTQWVEESQPETQRPELSAAKLVVAGKQHAHSLSRPLPPTASLPCSAHALSDNTACRHSLLRPLQRKASACRGSLAACAHLSWACGLQVGER